MNIIASVKGQPAGYAAQLGAVAGYRLNANCWLVQQRKSADGDWVTDFVTSGKNGESQAIAIKNSECFTGFLRKILMIVTLNSDSLNRQ